MTSGVRYVFSTDVRDKKKKHDCDRGCLSTLKRKSAIVNSALRQKSAIVISQPGDKSPQSYVQRRCKSPHIAFGTSRKAHPVRGSAATSRNFPSTLAHCSRKQVSLVQKPRDNAQEAM